MTRLLVSVRNVAEARIALEAGVDLLDVKEPRHGPLGAASPETISAVVQCADGRVPTSAALGELIDFDCQARAARLSVDYAKLGLAGCNDLANWPARWRAAWQTISPGCGRIAVAYADYRQARAPAPEEVLEQAIAAGCAGLLVDTFDKSAGTVYAHCTDAALHQWCTGAQQAGLLFVLAGSLRGDEIGRACELGPDYVGVRGAVCRGDRQQAIDAARVSALVDELRSYQPTGTRGQRSRSTT